MQNCKWITPATNTGDICPVFRKNFKSNKAITAAKLTITAMGVYEAAINDKPIGDFFMAPGWTSYHNRHPYQEYDVTAVLGNENTIEVAVGRGWYSSHLGFQVTPYIWGKDFGLIALLEITYADGTIDVINTDDTWEYAKSPVLFSELYDGEVYDARITPENWEKVGIIDAPTNNLVPQDGEDIREFERLKPIEIIKTPKGETVLDFGQNLTGRLEFEVNGKSGDKIKISHAEVFDKDGNFYTENLRTAKAQIEYICKDGAQTYKPRFTFMGFRYIRLDEYPYEVKSENFTAIVAHSDMKRTGHFNCSNPKINKLFENIIWGQKGNFLDVPTDCPQRDERLGWTGDAQVFVRAASYNFDVQKFFRKWLRDLATDQEASGAVTFVVPQVLPVGEWSGSSAWDDAAVICPWQIYLTYNDKEILAEQYESMQKLIEYIRRGCEKDSEFLFKLGDRHADWLGVDAPAGSYKGATGSELLATAFYAYSMSLFIKASKVLGKECKEYEEIYSETVKMFRQKFTYKTQTEHALALYFNLAPDKQATADSLAKIVADNGNKLTTGFVGTPYLLHALSQNGHADTAYNLLLQEDFPSWLYSVNQGATTIWEHWDGINENGEMWSADMNSFNHYAYGAVADWLYGVAAGIQIDEAKPGFEHVILNPIVDTRFEFLEASIETKHGKVSSKWTIDGGNIKYEFEVPNTATIIIDGQAKEVEKGKYTF